MYRTTPALKVPPLPQGRRPWSPASVGPGLSAPVGAALVPAIVITAGSAAGLAVAGLLFARFFGRRHAERIREQIDAGGLLLWIRADAARDAAAFEILRGLGAKDVHVHLLAKHWGVENVPLHDANPDPLLGASPRPTGL